MVERSNGLGVTAILALLLLAGFATDGRQLLDQGWLRGWGFSHRTWQASPVLQAIRNLPPVTIYTNEPDLVYFHTGRSSYIIFGSTDPVTGMPRQGYDEWLSLAKDTLAQGSAALVLVNVERLVTDAEDRAMVEALSDGLKNESIYVDGVILTAGGLP
jgi:hypothetical protein